MSMSFDDYEFELGEAPLKCVYKIVIPENYQQRVALGDTRESRDKTEIFYVLAKQVDSDIWFLDRSANKRATFSSFEDAKSYIDDRLKSFETRNKEYNEHHRLFIERIRDLKIQEIELEAKSRIAALYVNTDTIYGQDN